MDLNYLYLRRIVSLIRAERAACVASRSAHLGLARFYDVLIAGKHPHRIRSLLGGSAGTLRVAG